MKYLIAIKDIVITVLCILSFFFLLSFISKGNIPLIQQNNEVIMLSPMEAYLRGNIKIDDDNSITNWRNEKNVAHWRFKCNQSGIYKVTLIHNKSYKDFTLNFNCGKQSFKQDLNKNSKETVLGELKLQEGIQEVALYIPNFPKKSKLPAIFSIVLTKIK